MRTVLLLVPALLVLSGFPARAQVAARLGGTVKLFTSLFTEDEEPGSLFMHDAGDFSLSRTELWVRLDGDVSENVSFRSRVDFIHNIEPRFDDFEDLESDSGFSSETDEVDVYFREASFKVMDFPVRGLDLIVGRQRVRWGTSDEYNVIDNLNPVDYANLFSFDPDYFVDHIPMDGITLEYRLPLDFDLKLQAVYYISAKPSPLPDGFESYLLGVQQQMLDELTSPFGLPRGTTRAVLEDMPEYRLGDGIFGFRASGNLLNFDVGLSYYHGFQTLPLPKTLIAGLDQGAPSLEVRYSYPRLDVFGFDLAGELYSVGLWAEVGVYLSERFETELETDLPLGFPQTRVQLLRRPYTKFTVGFDYTFGLGDGLYWNTQFNRGFYDEFGYTCDAHELLCVRKPSFLGKLEDYYISYLQYAFFNDTLNVKPKLMLEVGDYGDFSDQYAWIFNPEVEVLPFDGTSLLAGYVLLEGSELSKFGAFANSDVFYLLLKAWF
ncbi:MAG: DUF1302 family protein [bacterium]